MFSFLFWLLSGALAAGGLWFFSKIVHHIYLSSLHQKASALLAQPSGALRAYFKSLSQGRFLWVKNYELRQFLRVIQEAPEVFHSHIKTKEMLHVLLDNGLYLHTGQLYSRNFLGLSERLSEEFLFTFALREYFRQEATVREPPYNHLAGWIIEHCQDSLPGIQALLKQVHNSQLTFDSQIVKTLHTCIERLQVAKEIKALPIQVLPQSLKTFKV